MRNITGIQESTGYVINKGCNQNLVILDHIFKMITFLLNLMLIIWSNYVTKSCDHFLVINDIKNPSMWSSTIRLPNEHTDRNQRNFQNFKYLWNTNFLNSIFQISPKLTKMICTLNEIEYFLSWMIRFLNLIRNPLKDWHENQRWHQCWWRMLETVCVLTSVR